MSEGINIDFKAARTVGRFMESKAFFRLIAGPVGSGKTTGCIFELFRRALEQKPGPDGMRYTRFAIVRQTLKQLKDTVLKDIEAQLKGLVRYKVSDNTIYMNFGDVSSEWLLIPLDDPEDQRRLLSMQLTAGWLSECIEMNVEIVEPVLGRCGRYPSRIMGGPTWFGAIADTNMPTEGDPWHKLMENPPPEWQVFRQPSGRDALAENLENLPGGREYYERLARGHSPEWVTRYVDAEYGPDPAGSAVHRNTFKREFHTVSLKRVHPIFGSKVLGSDSTHLAGLNGHTESIIPKEQTFAPLAPTGQVGRGVGDSLRTGLTKTGIKRATLTGYGFDQDDHVGDGSGLGWRGVAVSYALEPSQGYPLIICQDFGRNPCALIGQMDHKGRALVLEEIVSEDMGLQLHIEQHLMPALNSARFTGRSFYVIGDPAGLAKNNTYEESSFDTLKSHGLKAFPAPTNDQKKRIAAVDNLLLQQRDGGPALIIDADRCPVLTQALTAKYRYARRRSGQYAPAPEKLHPWSDVCFVPGTMISTPYGERAIETLIPGDMVDTHLGPRPVAATGLREASRMVQVSLSTGVELICTEDHPFWVVDRFIEACDLQYGHILKAAPCREKHESSTGAYTPAMERINTSGITPAKVGSDAAFLCTGQSGSIITALCQAASTSITSFATLARRMSAILSCYGAQIMHAYMPWKMLPTASSSRPASSRWSEQLRGMAALRDERGTPSAASRTGPAERPRPAAALTVDGALKFSSVPLNGGSVPQAVRAWLGSPAGWTTRPAHALPAGVPLPSTDTHARKTAPVVVGMKRLPGSARVVNLRVAGAHTYYAGGVLIRNCDDLQYFCLVVQGGFHDYVVNKLRGGARSDKPARPRMPIRAWT